MKKLLLILLCFPLIGFGQDSKLEIGFVNGITSSSIHGDLKDFYDNSSSINVNSILRTNGGLMLQYNISDLLSVNSKLLYQVKGWNNSGHIEITTVELPDGGIGTSHFDIFLYSHYISLPILMKLNFGNKLRGTINTGFYTSYLLKEIQESEIDNDYSFRGIVGDDDYYIMTIEQRDNERESSEYGRNRLDFGYVIGVGISYVIYNKIRLSFDSNLEYGLINKNIDEETSIPNYNIAYNCLFGCSYIL